MHALPHTPPRMLPSLAFVDIETTGAAPSAGQITEVAVVCLSPSGETHEWSSLVRPIGSIPRHITRLTGIDDLMVRDAPRFEDIASQIDALTRDAVFVAHNAAFDYGFLRAAFNAVGIDFRRDRLCTVQVSRRYTPDRTPHSLDAVISRHHLASALGGAGRHRALGDARLLHAFVEHIRRDIGDPAFIALVYPLIKRELSRDVQRRPSPHPP